MNDDADNVGKVADATKEVAKVTGKAIEALRDTGDFLSRVFGGLVEDSVGLVADRLKFYRMGRAVELAEKTEKLLLERGIQNTRHVPASVAIPLLESATLEDDDRMHDMWARLLSNAMDADAAKVDRSFVTILSDLTPNDATLLEKAQNISSDLLTSRSSKSILVNDLLSNFFGLSGEDEISFFNLLRLGLIFPSYSAGVRRHTAASHEEKKDKRGWFFEDSDIEADKEIIAVRISPLGHAFLRAVT